MIWKPSLFHTIMCLGGSLFISFIFVGFAGIIGGLLGYPFSEKAAVATYLIFAVSFFVVAICIPEDPDL